MTGTELINALIEGFRTDRVAVEKILLQHTEVKLFFNTGVGRDLVDIARAEEFSARCGVEHLLLTHVVAEAVDLISVAQRKGKGSVEVVDDRRAPFFKALGEYLLLSVLA